MPQGDRNTPRPVPIQPQFSQPFLVEQQNVHVDKVHMSTRDVGKLMIWGACIVFTAAGIYFGFTGHTHDRLMHADPDKRIGKGDLVYSGDLETIKDDVKAIKKQQKCQIKSTNAMKFICDKTSRGLDCKVQNAVDCAEDN